MTVETETVLVAAVDIGGTKVRTALVDRTLTIKAERICPSITHHGTATLAILVSDIETLLKALPGARFAGIGVGSPGVVDSLTAITSHAGLLTGWSGLDVRAALMDHFDVPVAIENDVNMAAIAEHGLGLAKGIDDFAFVAIGTGIGAGIFTAGRLHRGHHGAAGEIGYWRCQGRIARGRILEAVASGTGLGETGKASGIAEDTPELFYRAQAGERVALRILKEAGGLLGSTLGNLCLALDLTLVIFGGGVMDNPARELYLAPIKRNMASIPLFPPNVAVSAMGNQAAVVGAALAAWRKADGQEPY